MTNKNVQEMTRYGLTSTGLPSTTLANVRRASEAKPEPRIKTPLTPCYPMSPGDSALAEAKFRQDMAGNCKPKR